MNGSSPARTVLWLLWPVLIALVCIGAVLAKLGGGLPGRLAMPVYPADPGAPAAFGVPARGAGDPPRAVHGLQVTPGAAAKIGLGAFGAGEQPEHDLDVRADTVRIAARDAGGQVRLLLPEDVQLLLGEQVIELKEFIDSMQKRATVENLLGRLEQLEGTVAALQAETRQARAEAQAAAAHAGEVEKQAASARARANEAAGLAQQGIAGAREARELAERAQATGDRATGLANAAQGGADQATATAKRALDNTIALKRYVDLRNREIQENVNAHYRSNRPGGKELEFQPVGGAQ